MPAAMPPGQAQAGQTGLSPARRRVTKVTDAPFWAEMPAAALPFGRSIAPFVDRNMPRPPSCASLWPMKHSPVVSTSRAALSRRVAAQHGFTVVELIIVLAIGAILAAIAIPGMRDMLNSTRQSSAVSLLVNDLNQARGEAIKRNVRLLVCRRNAAGTDCVAGAAPVNWQAGWVVCMEGAVAESCAASTATDPNPVIVRPPLDPSLTLTAPLAVVRFSPNSSAAAAVNFSLGGSWSGATTRTVAVAITGNITKQ